MIRIINNSDILTHTGPLFKENNNLKLNNLHSFMLAQYMYKRRMCVDVMFDSIHECETRDRNNYYTRVSSGWRTRNFFLSFAVPSVWNILPNRIRNFTIVNELKNNLKAISDYN